MSGETGRRILECVPRFLGREEQFQLLQFCIPSILSKWKTLAKARTQNIEELHATFSKIAKLIKESDYELEWFVTNVFSQEEIDEFMSVLRYTMLDTLNRSYYSVREDISFLYSNVIGKLSEIDASVTLEYSANLLDCRLQLTNTAPMLEDNLMQDIKPPDMVTKFDKEYRRILLDYSIDCIKHDTHDPGRKHVGLYDLNSLLNTVKNIQDHNEYSARLAIEGSGGDFSIRIEKKSKSKIAFEIFKRAVALALVLLVAVLVCIFFTTIVLALWWLFIAGLFWLFSQLVGEIRDLSKEMKEYEQRRTKRFAES
ncbi:MAG: hypothetical protein ISS70_10185 [Phycisphaerae bacterium]|nr:hypothetical protein [Phycisphaerae bacterium]